jgi:hypothetical protein
MYQLCDGLLYAQKQNLEIKDLQHGNTGITVPGRVKLFDVGTAIRIEENQDTIDGVVGVPEYLSPEEIKKMTLTKDGALVLKKADDKIKYSPKSVCFSVGSLLYEFMTNEAPFEERDFAALSVAIQSAKYRPLRALNPDYTKDEEELIANALRADPTERWSLSDLRDRAAELIHKRKHLFIDRVGSTDPVDILKQFMHRLTLKRMNRYNNPSSVNERSPAKLLKKKRSEDED